MKKIILIFAALFFLVFISSLFINVTQKNEVLINTSFDNVSEQFSIPANWIKWHSLINEAWSKDSTKCSFQTDSAGKSYTIKIPGQSFQIKTINPLFYEVNEENNSRASSYYYEIQPATGIKSTRVITSRKTSLFYDLFLTARKGNPVQADAEKLKLFMESPDLYYGFAMKVDKVTDTVIATRIFFTDSKNLFINLAENLQLLQQYIIDNKLVIKNNVSVSYTKLTGDSLQVFFGIPVNIAGPKKDDINCRSLPKGKMLTAFYKGIFSNRFTVYTAMQKYIADNKIENVATSFEQYINNELPTSDTSQVQIKIYYPVF